LQQEGGIAPSAEVETQAGYTTVAPENKYLYNGKELSEDYGIDLYAYGFRYYDPAIGRFTGVDPLAEKYTPFSTYNYAVNNPVLYIDPDGKDAIITIDKRNKSIQVSQTFHYSSENLSANLKGVPNADASAEIYSPRAREVKI